MKTKGILLIETSLEGALAEESERRTLINVLRGMQGILDVSIDLFHERIQDIRGLQHVLKQCTKQNKQHKTISRQAGQISKKTDIKYIHINSHGNKNTLELPDSVAKGGEGSTRDFVRAFGSLKGANVRAIILSSCHTGQNDELAKKIITISGVKAVIAYPEMAYDDISSFAEQLLYFQLLRKAVPVWKAVRRVNDALIVLGEKEGRLLVCWTKEKGSFEGPYPWWTDMGDIRDRYSRSLISYARNKLVPKGGKMGHENLILLRQIMKAL
jgi:hypothetical protein